MGAVYQRKQMEEKMKTLYLDCSMGVDGSRLIAALFELLPNADRFVDRLNTLGIPKVRFKQGHIFQSAMAGKQLSITVNGKEEGSSGLSPIQEECEHDEHRRNGWDFDEWIDRHPNEAGHTDGDDERRCRQNPAQHPLCATADMERIVLGLNMPQRPREDAQAICDLIAKAQSHAHAVQMQDVHFRETDVLNTVAEVVAVCLLIGELSPEQIIASPVQVGSGQVKRFQEILPVPTPATAYILKGIPVYGGLVQGELCTAIGAACIRHFADRFGDMPVMRMQAIGYGMGKDGLAAANCVKAVMGDSEDKSDIVLELCCNVDDMTAEAIGFAMEQLLHAGALEVYTVPVGMKKSRPGTLLRVMCAQRDAERMIALIFRFTSTIGVRETITRRHVLQSRIEHLSTPYGEVRRKISCGYGVNRVKYEYDDLARIAKEKGVSLKEAQRLISDL